ncbi:MAG: hypothetical protein KBS53_02760 [Bacteroidales bacterium]|nr:hypothetical protein [Candidatus Hennigimonas equi]
MKEGMNHEPEAYVSQLQQRDSILIADQLEYGVDLPSIPAGAQLELPQVGDTLCADVLVVRPWAIDTLKVHRKQETLDLKASVVVTSFDEGEYLLPGIPVAVHRPDGKVDTLHFKGQDVLYCTIPVDTATFRIHDIKGQMRYPVTFTEMLPWIGGCLFFAALVSAAVYFWKKRMRKLEEAARHDPPHIVALRKLDAYRSDKYWAAPKQKAFYSGVTDALREYMGARYGIGAMEMTTAEIFQALKGSDLPEDMKTELKELFERSDYVKFAKYVATDQENAEVLPLGVRFVTTTYQEDIKEENNVL